MRWLLVALLVLLGSVAVALVALPDPGYVLLGYGKYSVETSLLVLLTVLVLAYIAVRALAGLWHTPGNVQRWSRRRHERRLQLMYDDAIRALAEDRLELAERRLARLLRSPLAPLQAYLAAAQAASRLGAEQRRDRYLELARQRQPESQAGILVHQAELQLGASQTDQAQTTLGKLQQLLAPHNPRLLRLLMQLYLQQHDWSRLQGLLPELRRAGVLGHERWQRLAVQVYREQVQAFSSSADLDRLKAGWRQLPATVQRDEALLAVYIEQLLRLDAHAQAGQLLREHLARDWNQRFVYLFGNTREDDVAAQQALAERWLERHPNDPVLLLSLGKISLRNRLWGQARSYLEASIAQQPTAEAYHLLANLLEKLEEHEAAAACYRQGLALSGTPTAGLSLSLLEQPSDSGAEDPDVSASRSA